MTIRYRLDARSKIEKLDYQYFASFRDAAIAEDRLKAMGYTVRIYFLSGDTISMRAHSNTLSWGWK